MTSAKSRLLLPGGLLLLSGSAFIIFTSTIGQGRVTGPALFLAGSVGTIGVVAYLLVRTAQALVETGVDAEAREDKAATGRRRKELEREYNTLKRAIKELELDYSMGKISEQDYTQVRTRYRERAVRILRQLDQGESYRAQIDRDLQSRLKAKGIVKKPSESAAALAMTPVTDEAKPDDSAATPQKVAAAAAGPKSGALATGDAASPESRVLPPGYEPSIISEEPTKASDAFALLSGMGKHLHGALPPGYEASIISEEPTKATDGFRAAAAQSLVHRDGMNFNGDSATVMRAVARLTGGNAVSTELTQQTVVPSLPLLVTGPQPAVTRSEPTQQTVAPCASCSATNDADANFCKKCGSRLHP